jgi:hypothetical protein
MTETTIAPSLTDNHNQVTLHMALEEAAGDGVDKVT